MPPGRTPEPVTRGGAFTFQQTEGTMCKPFIVINESDETKFEDRCAELAGRGYNLVTAHCGVVEPSDNWSCIYLAIFARCTVDDSQMGADDS